MDELTRLLRAAADGDRRACADEIRRRQRRRRLEVTTPPPERTHDDAAGGVELHALVDSLSPDRRAAFVLTQLLGLSYADAAETCEVPIGTIRSRVARAREERVRALDGRDRASG